MKTVPANQNWARRLPRHADVSNSKFLSETILKKIENYENLFIPKPGFLGPIYMVS